MKLIRSMKTEEVSQELMTNHGFSEFEATRTKVAHMKKVLTFCRKNNIRSEKEMFAKRNKR